MSQHKPRIAVFSFAYSPFEGGAEIAAREIMSRVSSYSFTVVTHRFDGAWLPEEACGDVRIVRCGAGKAHGADRYGDRWGKLRYIFRAWRAAERLHRSEPFRAVWAIMAAYGGIAALFFKLRHPRIPLILTLQEGDSEAHILRRVGLLYPFWRQIFKRADAVQAISIHLAEFAKRQGARAPVVVVPNGVDLDNFQFSTSPSSGDLPQGDNFQRQKKHEFTIITTSRLVHKNGIDILIRACALLKTLYPKPYTLRIVGDGPERKNLERLARELGVNERVTFLGQVSAADVPRHLAGADLFVRPARSEGLGSSFLEAMAAGLPVVGTPVGGIPDFLKDQETGLFARADDPNDLAEKMALLMHDAAFRRKLAARGRALVFERYGWDRIAERMENIFKDLCVS